MTAARSKSGARITRGLLVRRPHIDRILAGRKTWEIRGMRTEVRGPIALIQSGSGCIVGTCDICNVVGPLSLSELRRNARKAGVALGDISKLPYRKTYAWVLRRAKRFSRPRPYTHPSGAVIWVRLG